MERVEMEEVEEVEEVGEEEDEEEEEERELCLQQDLERRQRRACWILSPRLQLRA